MINAIRVYPKIKAPTELDYLEAENFFNFNSIVYSDEQRDQISIFAYQLMMKRETIQ